MLCALGRLYSVKTFDLGTESRLLTVKFCQSINEMSGEWKNLTNTLTPVAVLIYFVVILIWSRGLNCDRSKTKAAFE